MAVLLVFLGYVLGEMIAPGGGAVGVSVAAVVWLVQALVAFFRGDRIFLTMSGARRIEKHDHPRLANVVEEMSIAAGLPRPPSVYLIDDPAPNAFATGRKPETAAVAVTTGLLERLDRDELQGVVAHEIGHVKNRDIQFMLWAGIMVGTVVLLADAGARMLYYSGRVRRTSSGRSGSGGAHLAILLVGLLLVILAPVLAQVLYLACSRKREYLADASGALFTRYPEGLARALEKIARPSPSALAAANRVTAPMFIVNPLEIAAAAFSGGWFSTHPPTERRIRVLRAMSGASFADYERAWERVAGQGKGGLLSGAALKRAGAVPLRKPLGEPEPDHRSRARETTDLVWSLNGYRILSCPCGARLKIPPQFLGPGKRPACPRCGRVALADPAGRKA